VTGGGHGYLEESMSVVGVPGMTNASFIQTERAIGEAWKQELLESMAEAGREEEELAELWTSLLVVGVSSLTSTPTTLNLESE